jgi:hypothetical protein
MEAAFGRNFSHVRVYTDGAADRAARSVTADAYSAGPHIAFASGRYAPATSSGTELLAHELAHVVQQENQGTATSDVEGLAAAAGRRVARGASVSAGTLGAAGTGLLRAASTGSPTAKRAPSVSELAARLREAFRGPGTDEEEIYDVLSQPATTVRAVRSYYDAHFDDHTRKGLIEDLKDELSGDELARALRLLADAGITDVESPPILARKLREAFRGLGTDEDEIYRILAFPPATVRAMINYYNDHLNDHTGKGVAEDLRDELSGQELKRAMSLLAKAHIELNTIERKTPIRAQTGDPNKVWAGLIVRGKWSPGHHPGVMEMHADVVVPAPGGQMQTKGFFPVKGAAPPGTSGRAEAGLIGVPGEAADMAWFLTYRRAYVDLELAKLQDVRSSVILIKVTLAQAAELRKYWRGLKTDAGAFRLLGQNCSTAAAAGFKAAQVTGEISGLDTPDNLFEQIRQQYPDAYMLSGYYGYTRTGLRWVKRSSDSFDLVNPGSGPWQGPFVVDKRLR